MTPDTKVTSLPLVEQFPLIARRLRMQLAACSEAFHTPKIDRSGFVIHLRMKCLGLLVMNWPPQLLQITARLRSIVAKTLRNREVACLQETHGPQLGQSNITCGIFVVGLLESIGLTSVLDRSKLSAHGSQNPATDRDN